MVSFKDLNNLFSRHLIDPNSFNRDRPVAALMDSPDGKDIHMITHQNSHNGRWNIHYRFYGKSIGKECCFDTGEVYNIHYSKPQ